MNERHDYLEAV
ncbi:Putative uncharacterized protein [Lacticaseibacillus paracasei]|nr:Putative uncharacterized protein [Lacticaseibacillus paracasei]